MNSIAKRVISFKYILTSLSLHAKKYMATCHQTQEKDMNIIFELRTPLWEDGDDRKERKRTEIDTWLVKCNLSDSRIEQWRISISVPDQSVSHFRNELDIHADVTACMELAHQHGCFPRLTLRQVLVMVDFCHPITCHNDSPI